MAFSCKRRGSVLTACSRPACVDIDLKGPMHGPTNPRERRTFTKHRANGSLLDPAIPSRVEKSWFEFPIREPSPADDRVPKILGRLANVIAFAIEQYLQRNGPDRNYGIRLDAPEQRPWAMRDFVLSDPSGVLWRIAQNTPRPQRT